MKNKKKLLPLLLMFLIPITAYAAMQWQGTPHVDNIKNNLELISVKLDDLKTSDEVKDKEIKDIQKLLEQAEKDAQKQSNELEEVKQENATLKTDNNALNKQLEQALKDVQEIEQITEKLAND